jgi:hypothetical protein
VGRDAGSELRAAQRAARGVSGDPPSAALCFVALAATLSRLPSCGVNPSLAPHDGDAPASPPLCSLSEVLAARSALATVRPTTHHGLTPCTGGRGYALDASPVAGRKRIDALGIRDVGARVRAALEAPSGNARRGRVEPEPVLSSPDHRQEEPRAGRPASASLGSSALRAAFEPLGVL